MKTNVLALCLFAALLMTLSVAGLEASPPQQGAVITSPQDRDVVRGLLVIKGTATSPSFWKYEVYYAPEPNPNDQWHLLGLYEEQITDGRLETWDTTLVPDGTYSLRLRVVRTDGNYDEYYVRQLSVINVQVQPTETPTTTPTPEATRTPLPPTPTVIIEQPPTATPRPTSTPGPLGATPEPEEETGLNITVEGLGKALLYGAGGTLGLFLLMAVIIVLRQLISWLIAQF